MPKNPNDIAKKWARNLGQSGESIRSGVMGVTESPTQKAAQRADAYMQGVQRAVTDGKWQAGLNRVSTEDWRRAMLDKGLPRIASGASNGTPKMEAFMGEFLPHLEEGRRNLPARGGLENNIQRMVQMVQHNASFRRRR